jgi:23S rRNA pseudouridine2605 synthase
MKERLQKLMARADYGSRRACEQIILDGRVTVNGKIATLGDQADLATDDVRVDGMRLKANAFKPHYYVFNKPINVLSVNKAPVGDDRKTVRELLPIEGHLFVIGRLDAESEGLLVLTNDGEIAHKLAHPSFEHTKTYKVTVYGHPHEDTLQTWENGVWIDGKKTARCYIRVMEKTPKMTTLRIVMIEGRKRQIRRVASQLGYPVNRLVRTHIGQLGLGTLVKGGWYELAEEEVAAMLMPSEEIKFIKSRKRVEKSRIEGADLPTPRNRPTFRPKTSNSENDPEATRMLRGIRPVTARPSREGAEFGERTPKPRPILPRNTERSEEREDRPRFDRPKRDGESSYNRRDNDDRPRFDRPKRDGDDRPRFDRPKRDGDDRPRFDRPKRDGESSYNRRDNDDRPRFDRPKRDGESSYTRRDNDDRPRFDRPKRDNDDRPRFDRPKRDGESSYTRRDNDDRPRFDRPKRDGDDRPRFDRPKRDGESSYNRRDNDDRPRFDRPKRDGESSYNRRDNDDRPRFDRPKRDGESSYNRRDNNDRPRFDRPKRDGDDRPRFDRPKRDGESSYTRRDNDDRPRFDRPKRDGDDRPRFDRPKRDNDDRPRFDRPKRDGESSYTRRDNDDRPRFDRPKRDNDDRPRFDRPKRDSDDRPKRDGEASYNRRDNDDRPKRDGDKPRGERPQRDNTPIYRGQGNKPTRGNRGTGRPGRPTSSNDRKQTRPTSNRKPYPRQRDEDDE